MIWLCNDNRSVDLAYRRSHPASPVRMGMPLSRQGVCRLCQKRNRDIATLRLVCLGVVFALLMAVILVVGPCPKTLFCPKSPAVARKVSRYAALKARQVPGQPVTEVPPRAEIDPWKSRRMSNPPSNYSPSSFVQPLAEPAGGDYFCLQPGAVDDHDPPLGFVHRRAERVPTRTCRLFPQHPVRHGWTVPPNGFGTADRKQGRPERHSLRLVRGADLFRRAGLQPGPSHLRCS